MTKNIDLSIIIVNWNTKQLFLDCVASVYQAIHNATFEIFVVDNGDKLLDDYYTVRGWDQSTGYPKRKKLESLGLKAVADELGQLGRLG